MKRYAIWNKQDPIITPAGNVYHADAWKAKYPVAALDNITVVCAAGEINGAFFGTLGQMKRTYEAQGCDFSACTTNEEILEAIETFMDEQENAVVEAEPTPEERIAAALEYQVMASLPDEEETTEEV